MKIYIIYGNETGPQMVQNGDYVPHNIKGIPLRVVGIVNANTYSDSLKVYKRIKHLIKNDFVEIWE